ncbi:hypothetical protein A0257_07350 [Hymenobacter psoromatis]|nr:hypothetical protein A0257_07350 [Hymenobacter psoromatis]
MTTVNTFLRGAALALGCGLPLLAAAQSSELARDKGSNFNNGYAMPPAEANTLQGSPFLLTSWSPATILLSASTQPIAMPLKYDVYRQELRVRRAKGDSVVVPLAQVREFSLTGSGPARRFLCFSSAALPTEGGSCGEVLFDGPRAQLLKFVHKEVTKKSVDNGSYASNNTMSVLEEQTHYYLRWPADGHFTPLRLKRASLEQALAGQPAALAALKARKGSLSSEADFAAALAVVDPSLTVSGK